MKKEISLKDLRLAAHGAIVDLCEKLPVNERDIAASLILGCLPDKTPDGVKYTFASVRAAIQGEW